MRNSALLVLVGLLLPTVSVSRSVAATETSREAAPRKPSVILISIDTLRADRLPAYGYQKIETPAFDRLAREGVVFDRAFAPAPLTLPSHATLLTGTIPPTHRVRDNLGYVLSSDGPVTLAEQLAQAGYATAAFVSSYVLREDTGIGRGFQTFDDRVGDDGQVSIGQIERPGSETVELALEWIDQVSEQPFFVFLHLNEPHTPYVRRTPVGQSTGSTSGYDDEIVESDRILGQFWRQLDRRQLFDSSLVVLVSDHGEGLFDHGEAEHGILLYREALEVPLFVKLPERQRPEHQRAGTRRTGPVGLVDVVPTVLDYLAIPLPAGLEGVPLLGESRESEPSRAVYSETYYPLKLGWSRLLSVVRGSLQYIEGPDPELYDLETDPAQRVDLAAEQRQTVWSLRSLLTDLSKPPEAPFQVDAEVQRKLASLGYFGGSAAVDSSGLPDPKSRLASVTQLDTGMELLRSNQLSAGVDLLRKLVEDEPRMIDAWQFLAAGLVSLGKNREARDAYAEAYRLSNGAPSLVEPLAWLEYALGEPDRGLELIDLARRSYPDATAGLQLLQLSILVETQRFEEALPIADAVLDSGDPDPEALALRGLTRRRLGDAQGAETDLRQALEIAPRHPRALMELTVLLLSQGREAEADRLDERDGRGGR